ncbi:MAG: TetR/AcrR family transcriptional regulator [Phycicoccus sp.]
MGYRHQRADIVDAAVRVALAHGIGGLTFAAVARELGTNDRTVVYYLPTKDALLAEVFWAIGDRLRELLDEALGRHPAPADAVLSRVWPLLGSSDADPVFAVFFELIGRAVRPGAGASLDHTTAVTLTESWVEWMSGRISAVDADGRRRAALGLLAQLDGLLLLRQLLGPADASRAAAALGVSRTRPSGS